MPKSAGAILAALLFLTSIAFAQDGHFDASVNAGAVFTKTSTGNGISATATDGMNLFGTIRARFKPKHSVLFNFGRTKDSQVYQAGSDFHVLSTITEYTGAYMYSPVRRGKFEPFVFAGGGVLRFNPQSTYVFLPQLPDNIPNNVLVNVGATNQTRIAFLYGLGVDYKLYWKFALRLQYRGFLYKAPDFNVQTSSTGSSLSFFTGAYGHMAEPTAGLVFRF